MVELAIQLGTIFILNLIMNMFELGIPFIKHWWKVRQENKKVAAMIVEDDTLRSTMSTVEAQAKLDPYESPLDDYLEMVIQYGYVVLFCAAFPLITVLALIEISIEIRVDALKLCKLTRRPFPSGTEDIGIWKTVLQLISFFGIITNAAIIAVTSGAFDPHEGATKDESESKWLEMVLIFLVIEHGLIVLKLLIGNAIPDVPEKVK